MTPRQRFIGLLEVEPVSLAQLALLARQILREDAEFSDEDSAEVTQAALVQLQQLQDQARAAECHSSVPQLVEHLAGDLGFGGNEDNYYSPDNSDLSLVLTSRRGIPITLAIIYIELGRGLGFDLRGIGFPGHFLVGCYDGDGADSDSQSERFLIDPFAGAIVSRADCLNRLSALNNRTQANPAWPESQVAAWFKPATPRQILLRLLENLKQINLQRGERGPALAALELQLLIEPQSLELHEQQGALIAEVFGRDSPPPMH